MIWFGSDVPDFPEQLSKVIIEGAWIGDLKAEQVKFVMFKDIVLKYTIGNAVGKEIILNKCRKRGIPNEQLSWDK